MTAYRTCPNSSAPTTIHGVAQYDNSSTTDTAHNDNSPARLSLWSAQIISPGTSIPQASRLGSDVQDHSSSSGNPDTRTPTSGLNEVTQPSGTNPLFGLGGPVCHRLETATPYAFRGRAGCAQQPSPYARMPVNDPHRVQPGNQHQPAQIRSALCTSSHDYHVASHGDIGDQQPSTSQEITLATTKATQQETPIHGDPDGPRFAADFSSRNHSSDDLKVDLASATLHNAIPIPYQPMASLIASGTSYQLDQAPVAFGGVRLNHPHARALDRLTSSLQQVSFNNTEAGPVARIQRHFSPYYQGDIFLPANQSEDISDDLNCSLFIVNLPPSLTTHELVASIHKLGPLGRIFAIHINGPELQRNHPGCAAKVVFFKREVAHKFFTQCEVHGFRVKGCNARVMWNRIKTSEKPHLAKSDASRVLLIGGPPTLVNSGTLTDFFHTKLEFQIDTIVTHVPGSLGKEDAVIEYRFGSFRCQAQAAKMALARELPHIRCFFGKDPLEPEAYRPFEYFSFNGNV